MIAEATIKISGLGDGTKAVAELFVAQASVVPGVVDSIISTDLVAGEASVWFAYEMADDAAPKDIIQTGSALATLVLTDRPLPGIPTWKVTLGVEDREKATA